MEFFLAPLEGVTGHVVRNAFAHNFKGINKYYTPFIPAGKGLYKKTIRDIDSTNNTDVVLIPQLLSNKAEEVLYMGHLLQKYGYYEMNLNLGCPSGTVSSKKRGSGLLAYPEELEAFLDELFSKADFPISIKTRIGYESPDEWTRLLEIYSKYPITELTIHPRTRKDFYGNTPHLEAFSAAYDSLDIPLCYNGDIIDQASYNQVIELFPNLERIMIGRGLLANPALVEMLSATSRGEIWDDTNIVSRIRSFHDEIFDGYCSVFQGEKDAMIHMKEIWAYLIHSFEDSEKLWKGIRKAQSLIDYNMNVNKIFSECVWNPDNMRL